jgi:solute carrier family 8 (sodium/calcium exchanger)
MNNTMGNKAWVEQFRAALFEVTEEDDEDGGEGGEKGGPSKMDYFMHIITLPWKLLFAFVPPADYCGGWACFCGALFMIAIVTAIVGDMANLVGCCLGIKAEITAITFVALGTSLPDTFASMTAAQMDPYADASLGNVTGSNAVNVFMGIGLAWTLGAIYWATADPNDDWFKVLFKLDADVQKDIIDAAGCKRPAGAPTTGANQGYVCDNAVFITPAGSIWFNLMVFCVNALIAIATLELRRKKWGGELGGPKSGFLGQKMSGYILIGQWGIYIVASSFYAIVAGKSENKEMKYYFFGHG